LPTCPKPDACESALRRGMRGSLITWSTHVMALQGMAPAPHHVAMIRELDGLASGDTRRLMLLLPPGSAKSTYASLLFPAWWMARNPAGAVIAASHTASLAERFGRGVRSLLAEHAPRLGLYMRRDARAAGRFMTDHGGEYFAVGVHGAVIGRRADLALVDDPVSSLAEALNPRAREQLWNWFRSELITRLKPKGQILLVMTRWHPDDIAGRLIEQGGWSVLQLPAFAEADDPLGREPGAALWPEWEDRSALLAKQAELGERTFAALFQQAPVLNTGALFDTSRIPVIDRAPVGTAVRAWDLAGSSDILRNPDWTVGLRLLRDTSGRFVVEDIRRVRAGPADVAALIRATAELDGQAVTIGLAQDPGQAGLFQLAALTTLLSGFRVTSSVETGSKVERAQRVASQVRPGNVSLVRAQWTRAFLDELDLFPSSAKDDQVDALSRAFAMLVVKPQPARFKDVPMFAR
jgi:predicted phage terminase large subunit-like protein